jgi:hypothetical protein
MRAATAFLLGILAAFVPNKKSNIHPVLLGAIFGFLFTKILVGDYDRGYAWTASDLLFFAETALAGAGGAWLTLYFLQLSPWP